MKLQVGSGDNTSLLRRDGWVTLDADSGSGAEYIADVPPFPEAIRSQCWQRIEAIHVIEHLFLWRAKELLRASYEILEPGGLLILEAPDILKAAEYLLGIRSKDPQHASIFYDMYAIYGDQGRCKPEYQHRWGWTPQTLSDACHEVGFERVEAKPAQFHWPWRDFRVEAIR